jgi:hypothetical protein
MSFLAALVADLVKWGLGKLFDLVSVAVKRMQRRSEVQKQAEDSVKPLKDAKSAEEIDRATDSTLGGL